MCDPSGDQRAELYSAFKLIVTGFSPRSSPTNRRYDCWLFAYGSMYSVCKPSGDQFKRLTWLNTCCPLPSSFMTTTGPSPGQPSPAKNANCWPLGSHTPDVF